MPTNVISPNNAPFTSNDETWYDLVNHLVKVVQVAQNPSKAFDSFNLTMLSEDRKIFTSSCAGEMGSELFELIVDC